MKTHAWQRTIGALAFLPLLVTSLVIFSYEWLVLSSIIYLIIALTITAGYHRYFSHSAYQCNKFWQTFFGFVGTASLNSSPIEWSAVHVQHHKFTDTDNDPYDSTWRQFFKFKNRENISASRSQLILLKDPLHRFWVKNSAAVALGALGFLSLFGFKFVLFAYLLPVTAYLFTSYTHNILAHTNHRPRNFWFLEFVIPMCGEWIHKTHHEKPRLVSFEDKPYYIDLGGYFIKAIRNDR